MGGGALEIDISLEDGHFPVIPGLGSFTAGGLPSTEAEMFVRESDGAPNLEIGVLCFCDKLVCDRLHGGELVPRESDSGSLDFLIFKALFFSVFLSHNILNILIEYSFN